MDSILYIELSCEYDITGHAIRTVQVRRPALKFIFSTIGIHARFIIVDITIQRSVWVIISIQPIAICIHESNPILAHIHIVLRRIGSIICNPPIWVRSPSIKVVCKFCGRFLLRFEIVQIISVLVLFRFKRVAFVIQEGNGKGLGVLAFNVSIIAHISGNRH